METAIASDLDALQQLNRGYIRSVQNSDIRWFDEHLSDDFVNSNPDCTFVDRAEFLAQIAKPCAVSGLAIEDVRIQIVGEVAIIRARTTYVKPDGQPGAGRYTDVWARRGGRWICVAANVSRG
jgi:ketosteroid isomerase-like protein